MTIFEIILIAVGLASDAFAVSLGASASGMARDHRAKFRLSFHFGLFQFMMPVIGWFIGSTVVGYIQAVDHWIAFGLLCFVGIHMILADPEVPPGKRRDPSRGWALFALCVATSIDALAVGLGLAMVRINIWYPSAVIGIVTASLSLIGIHIGNRLSVRFGKRMEVVGGIVLILIGSRILLSHLLG